MVDDFDRRWKRWNDNFNRECEKFDRECEKFDMSFPNREANEIVWYPRRIKAALIVLVILFICAVMT